MFTYTSTTARPPARYVGIAIGYSYCALACDQLWMNRYSNSFYGEMWSFD
jgi:hypothetical protein